MLPDISGENTLALCQVLEMLSDMYIVLSDLRYLLNRESNDLQEFQRIAKDYYHRIAECADHAREMLPDEVIEAIHAADED